MGQTYCLCLRFAYARILCSTISLKWHQSAQGQYREWSQCRWQGEPKLQDSYCCHFSVSLSFFFLTGWSLPCTKSHRFPDPVYHPKVESRNVLWTFCGQLATALAKQRELLKGKETQHRENGSWPLKTNVWTKVKKKKNLILTLWISTWHPPKSNIHIVSSTLNYGISIRRKIVNGSHFAFTGLKIKKNSLEA